MRSIDPTTLIDAFVSTGILTALFTLLGPLKIETHEKMQGCLSIAVVLDSEPSVIPANPSSLWSQNGNRA